MADRTTNTTDTALVPDTLWRDVAAQLGVSLSTLYAYVDARAPPSC